MSISDMYVGPLHTHDTVTLKKTIVSVQNWQTKLCFQLYSWNYQFLSLSLCAWTRVHARARTHTHTHTHTHGSIYKRTSCVQNHIRDFVLKNWKSNELHC
jgi:hypothetical protein